jgi:hypothetical protein
MEKLGASSISKMVTEGCIIPPLGDEEKAEWRLDLRPLLVLPQAYLLNILVSYASHLCCCLDIFRPLRSRNVVERCNELEGLFMKHAQLGHDIFNLL